MKTLKIWQEALTRSEVDLKTTDIESDEKDADDGYDNDEDEYYEENNNNTIDTDEKDENNIHNDGDTDP